MNRLLASSFVFLALALLTGCARSPEERYARHLAKGKELFEKREFGRAIVEFRNAAQAMPRNAEGLYQLGLAASAAGDVRTAFLSFQKAASVDPQHSGAQLKLAQLLTYGDKDQLKDAEERLKAVAGQGGNTEALYTLAFTELRLGKVDDAISTLGRFLAESPGELTASVLLSRTRLAEKDVKSAEEVLKTACEKAPKSADARRILGEFYLTQSRLPEAEEQLRLALQMEPGNALALQDMARLALSSGRKEEAETKFRQLAALDAYKFVYAIFLFEQNRKDEAIREFERLAAQNPDDRRARTNLVASYLATDRRADAVKVLEAAIRKNPKDGDALLQRAEILIRDGKLADAETDLNQVRHLRSAAPEVHYVSAKLHEARGTVLTYRQELSEALRLSPALEPVRVELVRNLINNKEPRAALDILNAAPEAQKSSVSLLIQRNWALWAMGDLKEMRKGIDQGLTVQRSPDLLIQDGLWKLRAGNPSAAREALEDALKVDPSDLRALTALNQSYRMEKNAGMALQRVKEYAARQPKSAPVQEFLGLMLLAGGNRTQARAAFTAAKSANRDFTKSDLSLAQLDLFEGKPEDARKRLRAILDSNGADSTTAHLWLGNIETSTGNMEAALIHFRKVVELDPRNAQAANNAAYLLAEHRNNPDEALKYAERAVELAPDKAAYHDTLGWVLYRRGLYSAAVKHLERANSGARGGAVPRYHLAMAYAKLGQLAQGRATFEAALKLNPRVPEAAAARELLENGAR